LFLKSSILYLLVGIIAGIISGSKYVGSISSSIVILLGIFTPILLFESASLSLELLSYYIQKIGLIQILSIIIGGYFGGFFISKYFDEEDYIILNVD
jgi:fumarate reductase subunit D